MKLFSGNGKIHDNRRERQTKISSLFFPQTRAMKTTILQINNSYHVTISEINH